MFTREVTSCGERFKINTYLYYSAKQNETCFLLPTAAFPFPFPFPNVGEYCA